MHVIGTAGHVDHGKSTLIEALTGIDPDRLAEEKQRGMTIDLGFAWATLPSGREVGIVDVPGHQRFIKNMLAGAGAISMVLFVVAATEGWMPQSEEHFEILELLGIRNGVIALNKTDLVDSDWLELVTEEIREHCEGTFLQGSAIYPVSPITGKGMDRLIAGMDLALGAIPEAPDRGKPALWIDRSFTIKGSGTVVTGTLLGGNLHSDQEVEIMPPHKRARIRGLQTHKKSVEVAVPGSRVAVNLVGVDVGETGRGQLLSAGSQRNLTARFNATITVSSRAVDPLKSGRLYKLYLGTAEVDASLKLFDRDQVNPGQTGCGQFRISQELPLQFGDRLVIRDPGADRTAGGGRVLDPIALGVRGKTLSFTGLSGRERRFRRTLGLDPNRQDVRSLIGLSSVRESQLLKALLDCRGSIPRSDMIRDTPLGPKELSAQLGQLREAQGSVELASFVLSAGAFESASARVVEAIGEFHSANPLKSGIPLEELREKLGTEPCFFEELMDELRRRKTLEISDAAARLPGRRISLDAGSSRDVEEILGLFRDRGFAPPTYDELVKSGYKPDLIGALVDRGELTKISREFLFLPEDLMKARITITSIIRQGGSITVSAARDALGTSRKYVVPLLEYFDRAAVTRRIGDQRVAGTRFQCEKGETE